MSQPEPSWQLLAYQTKNRKIPFIEWLESLDGNTQKRIEARLSRLRYGNFGDSKSVGEGVYELRFAFGSGYRIYYGRIGSRIVLLLCGGDKHTQAKDIDQAQKFWKFYCEEKQ